MYRECVKTNGVIKGTAAFFWIRAMRKALDKKPDLHFRIK